MNSGMMIDIRTALRALGESEAEAVATMKKFGVKGTPARDGGPCALATWLHDRLLMQLTVHQIHDVAIYANMLTVKFDKNEYATMPYNGEITYLVDFVRNLWSGKYPQLVEKRKRK